MTLGDAERIVHETTVINVVDAAVDPVRVLHFQRILRRRGRRVRAMEERRQEAASREKANGRFHFLVLNRYSVTCE